MLIPQTHHRPRIGYAVGGALPAALLAVPLFAAAISAQAPHRTSDQEHLITVTHARVPSAAFHSARDVYVWLPDAEGTPGGRYLS